MLEILFFLRYTVIEVIKVQVQGVDPRQEMHSETLEVFHYREPRIGGVEVHHHDFYEVYYLLDGQVEYWVDGRIIRMKPGDLLLINPQELHRPLVGSDGDRYERIVLWIHKDYLENLASGKNKLSRCFDQSLPNRICPADAERPILKARMHELVCEFYSRDFGSGLCAQGLFLQLMVQLNRLALRTQDPDREESQMSALVQQTMNYIRDNISAPLSLEGIAGHLYVSKYHLSHAFSREVGVSLYRYIMLRRLLLARQLLLAGQGAGQVSISCGFSDYASFYRAFKAEYGVSPREYAAHSG